MSRRLAWFAVTAFLAAWIVPSFWWDAWPIVFVGLLAAIAFVALLVDAAERIIQAVIGGEKP